jgi:protein-tyrosine phosphatase
MKIIEFVACVHGSSVEGIMVHCKAGISRSAAVAKYIADKYKLPFNHSYDRYNKQVYGMLIEAEAGSFL